MKLTVDASIVVKWFVAEALSKEARLLLAHRLDLHAPDLLLAEFANTIWKKARRSEIPDPQSHFDELANLPDLVTLHSSDVLIQRAAQFAVEIGHPIYDCLYLACAEGTASVMITADQRLANKIAGRLPNIDVRYIGAPSVARQLDAAATDLVISRDKVEELIAAYEFFAATERHVVNALRSQSEGSSSVSLDDLFQNLESPAFVQLRRLIDALNEEELIDLAALGWLGSFGHTNADWRGHLEHASRMVGELDCRYLTGYGQHWRTGYTHLTRMTKVRERAPLYV